MSQPINTRPQGAQYHHREESKEDRSQTTSQPAPPRPLPLNTSLSATYLLGCSPHFAGREQLFAKLAENFFPSAGEANTSRPHLLTGAHGIGKGECVRQFAKRYKDRFFFIWCFNGEDNSALNQSYVDLARRLQIPVDKTKTDHENQTVLYQHMEQLAPKFNDKLYLFVFKNLMGHPRQDTERFPKARFLSTAIKFESLYGLRWIQILSVPSLTSQAIEELARKLGYRGILDPGLEQFGDRPILIILAIKEMCSQGYGVQDYFRQIELGRNTVNTSDSQLLVKIVRKSFKSLEGRHSCARDFLNCIVHLNLAQIPIPFLESWLQRYHKVKMEDLPEVKEEVLNAFSLHLPVVYDQNVLSLRLPMRIIEKDFPEIRNGFDDLFNLLTEPRNPPIFQNWRPEDVVFNINTLQKSPRWSQASSSLRGKLLDDVGFWLTEAPNFLGEAVQFYLAAANTHLNIEEKIRSLNCAAITLTRVDRHEEALESVQKVLQLREQSYGKEHPKMIESHRNVGRGLANLGKFEEALRALQQGEELFAADTDRWVQAGIYGDMANSLAKLGRFEEALKCYHKMEEVAAEDGSLDGDSLAEYRENMKRCSQKLELRAADPLPQVPTQNITGTAWYRQKLLQNIKIYH
ncbi:MAG: tetratricopeptide repeat protein [Chlamydiales bacterium]